MTTDGMGAYTASPAWEARDVCRIYSVDSREVQALRGINLTVQAGEFVALKGRSGSGKTTLLNCLGGLDKPTSGAVRCFGSNLQDMTESELTCWRRDQVGYIFQSFALLPTLSAYENVELMLRLAQAKAKDRRERTSYCLDLVGLAKWSDHRPYEMSGGQQQRVAIARALANSPRLLLADEATGELDSQTAREIMAFFRRIVDQEHLTLVLATHDALVDSFADRVIRLADGQIIPETQP
ncbi:MAG: ABC transporter ATP-binding protein [Chloroflexi bacterium]|nr:ABC transporter ATP-binding protein [Chloroflexota bacterium]